jgi:integrase
MRVWTMQQTQTFLNSALTTEYGLVFALATTTGMRPSEYLALFWKDVDWDRGTDVFVTFVGLFAYFGFGSSL